MYLISLSILVLLGTFIYRVLQFTPELNIHQQRGAVENTVYISKDGHKEAVYNKNGKLVTDAINKGSYNYCHPRKEPICHFFKDSLPWIILGNDQDDLTSVFERLNAYSKDLLIGIQYAFSFK